MSRIGPSFCAGLSQIAQTVRQETGLKAEVF